MTSESEVIKIFLNHPTRWFKTCQVAEMVCSDAESASKSLNNLVMFGFLERENIITGDNLKHAYRYKLKRC